MQHGAGNVRERGEKIREQALAQVVMLQHAAKEEILVDLIRQARPQNREVKLFALVGFMKKIGVGRAEEGIDLFRRLIRYGGDRRVPGTLIRLEVIKNGPGSAILQTRRPLPVDLAVEADSCAAGFEFLRRDFTLEPIRKLQRREK